MAMKLLADDGQALDGTFEVAAVAANNLTLILHAKGGSRDSTTNGDYNLVLEGLLECLRAHQVAISNIAVDSRVARDLPAEDRRILLEYLITLSPATDCKALRIRITEGQPDVATTRPKGAPGGNKHKRIRIDISSPGGTDLVVASLKSQAQADPNSEDVSFGADYFDDSPVPQLAPSSLFTRDDSKLERSLTGHAETQRTLAQHVRQLGYQPRKRAFGEPDFDIAWEDRLGIVVAEVKSLGGADVVKQLRLGIGQVLHYQYLLASRHKRPVRAVLAVERDPGTPWKDVCAQAEIVLVWPPAWTGLERSHGLAAAKSELAVRDNIGRTGRQ